MRDENVFNLPDDDPRMINLADHWEREMDEYLADAKDPARITATPFAWPDPAKIPPRQWLFGRWILRGEVTAIVAPGGIGKSTFVSAVALSIASGKDFLGKTVWEGAGAVWIWNLEDDKTEMERSLMASSIHHATGPKDCPKGLYVDSGLDQRLCTAIEDAEGFKIIEPIYDNLKAEIIERGIDLLTVDPFVSSHEVDENKNSLIDAIGKRWKKLAHETGCSIVLVHHTRKTGGQEVKAEHSRGAVSLINVARSTLVLNHMTQEEGERFGITDKAERASFVRVDDDKPNRAPAENAWWMKKHSVPLGNLDDFGRTDEVGAAAPWTPPDPFDGLSTRDLYNVQLAIDAGEYGENVQAKDWAGIVVADVLGFDLEEKKDKERVKSLIRTWKGNKALTVKREHDGKRERPYLVVGNWVDPTTLSTSQGGVEKVENVGAATPRQTPSTTTFYKVGGGGGGVTTACESEGGKDD